MKKLIKLLAISLVVIIIGTAGVFGINSYVIRKSESKIIEASQVSSGYDCILVLGCKVEGDRPSHMLRDRLNTAIELYKQGAADKIIMSGDHGREEYDEVNVMKSFAIENGIPSEDIFMDHAGFSTYESVYRAKEIFRANKILIVTQKYHLYRAIYDAESIGIEANGVASDFMVYSGQRYRDFREILARNKDFLFCIIKPEPEYLGEAMPVWGNGDITNDK